MSTAHTGILFRRQLKGHLVCEPWIQRSVTSDMWRLRKTLTYKVITLISLNAGDQCLVYSVTYVSVSACIRNNIKSELLQCFRKSCVLKVVETSTLCNGRFRLLPSVAGKMSVSFWAEWYLMVMCMWMIGAYGRLMTDGSLQMGAFRWTRDWWEPTDGLMTGRSLQIGAFRRTHDW